MQKSDRFYFNTHSVRLFLLVGNWVYWYLKILMISGYFYCFCYCSLRYGNVYVCLCVFLFFEFFWCEITYWLCFHGCSKLPWVGILLIPCVWLNSWIDKFLAWFCYEIPCFLHLWWLTVFMGTVVSYLLFVYLIENKFFSHRIHSNLTFPSFHPPLLTYLSAPHLLLFSLPPENSRLLRDNYKLTNIKLNKTRKKKPSFWR